MRRVKKLLFGLFCVAIILSLTIPISSAVVAYTGMNYNENHQSPAAISAPNVEWSKTFGGPEEEGGYSVQQTTDGGYVIAGVRTYADMSEDVLLIKIDSSGNKLWENVFGESRIEEANSVQQTLDGGYIIAGTTNSFGAGESDVWLVKTDSLGNKLWDKTFGGSGHDLGYSVQQTLDGGYVIAGMTSSYSGGQCSWLIKTDSSGNKLWDKTFGASGIDWATSVQQTRDGGYIITGFTRGQSGELGDEIDVSLIKTDANGNNGWYKVFSGLYGEAAYSVDATQDGGYVIGGYIQRPSGADAWLIKTDANGSEQWNRVLIGSGCGCWGYSAKQTNDGGYIFVGQTLNCDTRLEDAWILKTYANGTTQWEEVLGGAYADGLYSVEQTQDSGYVVAGVNHSYGSGDGNVWVVKLASEAGTTPKPPTLVSPGSDSEPGQLIENLTPKMQWTSVPGADYYSLAISKYPYGSLNIIHNPTMVYGTSYTLPSGILEYGQKYRWNMRSHNTSGWSTFSDTWYFMTPLPPVDITIDRIIALQSVEETPLVKDKPTVVRAFVTMQGASDLEVVPVWGTVGFNDDIRTRKFWLVNLNGSTYSFTSATKAEELVSKAQADPAIQTKGWFKMQIQYNGIDALNFDFFNQPLKPQIASDEFKIGVGVTPVERSDSNSQDNLKIVTNKVKAMSRDLKIMFQRARPWYTPFTTSYADYTELAQDHFNFMVAMYPIAPSHIVKTTRDDTEVFGPAVPILGKTVMKTSALIYLNTVVAGIYWKAVYVVPDDWLGAEGLSTTSCTTAVFVSDTSLSDTTAHEIGHTYGGEFPDVPQWIVAANGWDTSHNTVDLARLISGPAKMSVEPNQPSSTFNFYDLMGGGWPLWITKHHYDIISNDLVAGGPDPRVLFVNGALSLDGGVYLAPFYSYDGFPHDMTPGDWSFEALSSDGSVLSATSFNPEVVEEGIAPFAFAIAYPQDTTRVVLKHNDTILAERILTDNCPVLTVDPVEDLGNGLYSVQWQGSDADQDTLQYLVYYSHNCGDWVPLYTDGQSLTFDSAGLPGGTATIKVIATDGMNTTEALSAPFSVQTKPPYSQILLPEDGSSFIQGDEILFRGNGFDFEDGQLSGQSLGWSSDLDGFLDYGESVGVSNLSVGSHDVTLTAVDYDGMISHATVHINVVNVSPAVAKITAPVEPVSIGTEIGVGADFTDPGLTDTHSALWDWGDGSITEGIVVEADGFSYVRGDHSYNAAGVFTIALTITDEYGDSSQCVHQYVVVYDPSAGFVTGGGWINSPLGAYAQDPLLTGKATFGFVSKYKKGASVPTGNTEFQFHAAGMNFKSTSYQWLVIAGAKAQYKGSGTINGSGDYGFMLTAIDGQINGGGGTDKFRIKIWDKATSTIVYDNMLGAADTANPTTVIAGGSIVIHK